MKNLLHGIKMWYARLPFIRDEALRMHQHVKSLEIACGEAANFYYIRAANLKDSVVPYERELYKIRLKVGDKYRDNVFVHRALALRLLDPPTRLAAMREYHAGRYDERSTVV